MNLLRWSNGEISARATEHLFGYDLVISLRNPDGEYEPIRVLDVSATVNCGMFPQWVHRYMVAVQAGDQRMIHQWARVLQGA